MHFLACPCQAFPSMVHINLPRGLHSSGTEGHVLRPRKGLTERGSNRTSRCPEPTVMCDQGLLAMTLLPQELLPHGSTALAYPRITLAGSQSGHTFTVHFKRNPFGYNHMGSHFPATEPPSPPSAFNSFPGNPERCRPRAHRRTPPNSRTSPFIRTYM